MEQVTNAPSREANEANVRGNMATHVGSFCNEIINPIKPPMKEHYCAPQSAVCNDDHWPYVHVYNVTVLKLFAINLSFHLFWVFLVFWFSGYLKKKCANVNTENGKQGLNFVNFLLVADYL